MIPILYNSNASDFTQNGYGFFSNCLRCECSRELNGEYELEIHISPNDRLAKIIAPQMIVKVKANPIDSPQLFDIYNVSKKRNLIVIKARHVRYRIAGSMISEPYVNLVPTTPTQIWENILELVVPIVDPFPFSFSSDITSTGYVQAAESSPIRLSNFLIGHEDSMLSSFNGELKFDNFSIYFNHAKNPATEHTGVCLRCGAGLSNVEYDISTESMYSAIYPYASLNIVTDTGEMKGSMIAFRDAVNVQDSQLVQEKILPYDFTQMIQEQYPQFQLIVIPPSEAPTNWESAKQILYLFASRYAVKNKKILSEPNVQVKVRSDAIDEQLQICDLGDWVYIYYEPLNLSLDAKITKTVYNSLTEKYTSVEVGNYQKFSKLFSNINIEGA